MVYLTRRETFNAAHKLWVNEWSEAENVEIFGKCANKNWHGHNYILYVTIKGIPDPTTGFIIDAKKLSTIIREHITEKLDHSNLNLDVAFIPKNVMPTTENLVICIWHELKKYLSDYHLYALKLQETENIYAEYFGEE